jgi:hypothetical protein
MTEYTLPTLEGRTLLVRPCDAANPRPLVQVAILSTRGNIIEAVTIEAGDVLGLCGGLGKVGRFAATRARGAERRARVESARRHRRALARNPWLQKEREKGRPHG